MKIVVHPKNREFAETTIKIVRTARGWSVSGELLRQGSTGECDNEGKPDFFNLLDADGVDYPHQVTDFLGGLWRYCDEKNPSKEFIQKNLDDLGAWIDATERAKPDRKEFETY